MPLGAITAGDAVGVWVVPEGLHPFRVGRDHSFGFGHGISSVSLHARAQAQYDFWRDERNTNAESAVSASPVSRLAA